MTWFKLLAKLYYRQRWVWLSTYGWLVLALTLCSMQLSNASTASYQQWLWILWVMMLVQSAPNLWCFERHDTLCQWCQQPGGVRFFLYRIGFFTLLHSGGWILLTSWLSFTNMWSIPVWFNLSSLLTFIPLLCALVSLFTTLTSQLRHAATLLSCLLIPMLIPFILGGCMLIQEPSNHSLYHAILCIVTAITLLFGLCFPHLLTPLLRALPKTQD